MKTDSEKMLSKTRAAAEGAASTALLVAVLTIGGELWHPLKDTLKAVFTHHWLGKSVLAAVIFIIVFLLRVRSAADPSSAAWSLYVAVGASILSALLMLGFFISHAL